MRVELVLDVIVQGLAGLQAVRNAMSGVAGAAQAAPVSPPPAPPRWPGMHMGGGATGRFGGYLPPSPSSPPPPPPPTAPEEKRKKTPLEKAREAQAAAQSQLVGALATAASIAAPIKQAVTAFNKYEDALNDVGQKADLTGAKLAAFGETIRAQARALNISSTEILKGVDQLAAGGMSVPDAAASFPAIGRAAIATKATMEDLSKTTVSLVNNLKIAPAEVIKALDAMHQSGKDGQFELKDMARFFPKIGAQYAAMGQTGHKAVLDLAAALQIMRMNVGTAGEAVTNLQDLLSKMTMKPAQKAFEAAGIDVVAEMAKARETGRVMETMHDLIQKATGGDMSKIQTIFTDKQARAGAEALIQHYKEYLKMRQSAEGASGVVDRDFATRMQLGVEKTRALQVATAELWTTLGQALAPAFAQRVEQLTKLINRIEASVKANPQLAAGIAQVATALAGVLVVSAGLAVAFTALRVGLLAPVAWLARLAASGAAGAAAVRLLAGAAWLLALPFKVAWWAISGFFSGFASALAADIAAVGGWRAAMALAFGRLGSMFMLLLSPLRLAAQAVMAFGAALLATPVGWIAAAVAAFAAAAYLIYANWDKLGPWFAQLWARIKTIFADGWAALSGWFAGLGARIGAALSSAWAGVAGAFDGAKTALANAWSGVAEWFASLKFPTIKWPELPAIPDFFGPVLDKLKSGWATVKDFVGSIELPKFSFGGAPGAAEVKATAEQAAAAKKAIEALTPAAVEVVAAVGAVFKEANFAAQGQAMMTTLATGIRNGSNVAVAAARDAVQKIRDHLPHSPAKVGPLRDLDRVQFGQTLAAAIAAGAPKAVAAARALAEGVAGTLPGAATPAFAMAGGRGGGDVRSAAGGGVQLTFAPTIHGAAKPEDMLAQLRTQGFELLEMIRAELDRRERAKH